MREDIIVEEKGLLISATRIVIENVEYDPTKITGSSISRRTLWLLGIVGSVPFAFIAAIGVFAFGDSNGKTGGPVALIFAALAATTVTCFASIKRYTTLVHFDGRPKKLYTSTTKGQAERIQDAIRRVISRNTR
jgi:hypothetical protein